MTVIAAGQSFLDDLGANIPLVVGVIGFISGVVALVFVKPPSYKEVVDEARGLRGDLEKAETKAESAAQEVREMRKELDDFREERSLERAADRKRIGILSDGVEALWGWTETLVAALHNAGQDVPEPSDYVKSTMQRARDARLGDVP